MYTGREILQGKDAFSAPETKGFASILNVTSGVKTPKKLFTRPKLSDPSEVNVKIPIGLFRGKREQAP